MFKEDADGYIGYPSFSMSAISGNNTNPYNKKKATKANVRKYFLTYIKRGANPRQARTKTEEYFS